MSTLNSFTYEYVDPYDRDNLHFWIKIEHLARYIYAADRLGRRGGVGLHLDLGCGAGYGISELARGAARVIGLDYDAAALDKAGELLANSREWAKHTLVGADVDSDDWMERLKAAAGGPFFDSVTAFEFFEHLVDPPGALQGLGRLLRPGAFLFCSIPNEKFESVDEHGKPLNAYHRHIIGADRMAAMLADAGFSIEEVLGQAAVNRLMRQESRLARKGRISARLSEQPRLQQPDLIRAFALARAYPDLVDVDNSYCLVFVARLRGR
jgi:2-polyprenyl-3-methyl-5-hydroxy-6-metoxy-1,4-benzoquinol methylase